MTRLSLRMNRRCRDAAIHYVSFFFCVCVFTGSDVQQVRRSVHGGACVAAVVVDDVVWRATDCSGQKKILFFLFSVSPGSQLVVVA